jgi:hypothetical protein
MKTFSVRNLPLHIPGGKLRDRVMGGHAACRGNMRNLYKTSRENSTDRLGDSANQLHGALSSLRRQQSLRL